jgi:tetratricopeptide (TPR) repeat protein
MSAQTAIRRALTCSALLGATVFGTIGIAQAEPSKTPAEMKIEAAQRAITREPASYTGYNDLALALTKRARETSDHKYYEQAMVQLEKSQTLSPDNFEGQKVRVWALLGQHEFGEAYRLAKALNAKVPDDVQVYGLLVDAAVELGEYEEAEKAGQWMLNLRPGNGAALTRAAYLREMFGDIEGALDLMQMAAKRAVPTEREERAWMSSHIAHLLTVQGKFDAAARHVDDALKQFPDYHYALAKQGEMHMRRGKWNAAVESYRKRYAVAPHPENLFDVGVALHAAGKRADARKAFEEFERDALKESASWDNANRELIHYYTDYANQPAKAMKIAAMQIAQRRDAYSLEAHAWALYRSGKFADAKESIEKALSVGVMEPRMQYRAAMIFAATRDKARAAEHFSKAEAAHPDPQLKTLIARDRSRAGVAVRVATTQQ